MTKQCYHATFRRRMLGVLVLLFSVAFTATAQNVSLNMENKPIREVLAAISETTTYKFVYSNSLKIIDDPVTIKCSNLDIDSVLKQIFNGKGISYKIDGKNIALTPNEIVPSKSVKKIKIKGIVVDSKKEALAGAYILIKGTKKGTSADVDGTFSIDVNSKDVLLVSYIGYDDISVSVSDLKNINNVEIVLTQNVLSLEDAVVVGYGTTKRKDLTGSVAHFDSKIIEESSSSNLAQMMQGQVSGLSILSGSGMPGEAAHLEIRGVPSLSGSTSPLIVVDGIPMAEGYDLNELNPDDVKNIDVLKGASSAAIYGSRAASGVIMVTTKFGIRDTKPEISYSYNFGLTTLVSKLRTLTTNEYKMLLMEGVANSAYSAGYEDVTQYPTYKTITADNYFGEYDTPWMNLLMHNGTKSQHNVSIRGGSNFVGYNASFGYTDEDGQMIGTNYKRINYDMGFNSDVSDFIKATIKFSGVSSNQTIGGSSITSAATMRPDIKAYNEDGSYYLYSYYYGTTKYHVPNPLIEQTENKTNNINNNYRITGNLEFTILPELKLTTQYTYQYRNGESDIYKSSRTQAGSNYYAGQLGEGSKYANKVKSHELEARLNYGNVFGKHGINAVAVMTYTKDRTEYYRLTMRDFADDYIQNAIYQGANFKSITGDSYGSLLMSYVGRAEYKYDEKYLLTSTVRFDGSSRFSPKYRWGIFPSVALGWIISEENFMKNQSVISFLKLRAGWGKTGNAFVGEYGWRTLYTTGDYAGSPTVVPNQIGNDELKWESTNQIDIGIDFGFGANQRIRGSIGVYDKNTSGLMYPLTLSPSTGLSSTNINYANINNKGIELELFANLITTRNVTWSVGFNIGRNINKVTGLDAEIMSYLGYSSLGNTVIKEGKSLGLIYGFKTDGIFQSWEEVKRYESLNPNYQYQEQYSYRKTMPGDLKYVDLSGDGRVNKTWNNNEDKAILGCSRPDFEGGFNTRLTWKNFTFALQGTFSFGAQKIWNAGANAFNISTSSNQIDLALKRWTPDNPSNKYPSIRYNYYYNDFCDFSVHDASYVKIQNISLEYKLPYGLIGKVKKLNNIKLFCSINNVYTFTNYPGPNPESYSNDAIQGSSMDNSIYPQSRIFNFGVKVTIK